MKDVREFLDNFSLHDDITTIETLQIALGLFTYYIQEYHQAKIDRRIKEAMIFMEKKKAQEKEKKTIAEIEKETTIEVQNELKREAQLEAIVSALEEILITGRKILDYYIREKGEEISSP